MTVTVSSVVSAVKEQLNDASGTRYNEPSLLSYLNDGQLKIVTDRPDANPVTEAFTCIAGTRQTIPIKGLRFIKAISNSVGGVVRIANFDELNEIVPDWHNVSHQSTVIDHYLFDPKVPKEFYVYPFAQVGSQITISFSVAPDLVGINDNIDIDDSYAEALRWYMIYRAHSKNTKFNQRSLADHAFAMYQNLIGAKNQVDAAISPKSKKAE